MPARRKTAAELALSGALRKNRKRYENRGSAPAGEPLGYAPRHLSDAEKDIWRDIARLAPAGLLSSSDEFAIELAAKLIARSRTTLMKASEVATLVALLGRLGLTPVDRARMDLPAPQKQEENPFDEFED